jgi:hypothetical protein
MAALQATLVAQLRSDIRPVARRIAEERGMSIVMETSEAMMYVADECDITDEVIAAMRQGGLAETPPSQGKGSPPRPQTQPATSPATQP